MCISIGVYAQTCTTCLVRPGAGHDGPDSVTTFTRKSRESPGKSGSPGKLRGSPGEVLGKSGMV